MLTETANTGGGTDFWRKDGELLWTYQACKKTERERIIPLLMATHSSTLAWKMGCRLWGRTESDTTEAT